jgi:asparagine synthetase B (glutamine-hydrolysing)
VSSLVGAWALSDGGDPTLSAEERARLRATLSGDAGSLREIRAGRMWLCAPAEAIAEGEGTVVAGEGFFAEPGLAAAIEPGYTPEGHFALVRWDRAAGELTLFRSLSGGERLYYARPRPDLLVFATTVWPLCALLGTRLEPRVLDEVLLTGLTMFGTETLHRGVHEILPGHQLVVASAMTSQRVRCPEVLTPPVGDPEVLAAQLRERLTAAVAAGAGPNRPVAVALSGGIDSSAIAAAAVDAFGADAIHAITYEFDDPGHSTEVEYASRVARRLGIRRHHVFPLPARDYLAAIPEMVYRSESLVHWPKAFMLVVAREVARLGYDRYLTGFGIGSHLSYLSELGRGLARAPRAILASWKPGRFTGRRWPDRLGQLHPAFEPPHPRLYYMLVRLLAARGLVRDVRRFFPEAVEPLLGEDHDVGEDDMDLPLGPWLQRRAFARGVACIDVTRSEKASRELGVYRVSPAHFDRCISYCHYPIEPRPRLYSAARKLRPGKYLLRLAYRDVLPDEVIYRVKSWGDAVASDRWLRAGRRLMLSVLPDFPNGFAEYGAHYPDVIKYWESKSILASGLGLRLWKRMFVDLPRSAEPPSWRDLWLSLKEQPPCVEQSAAS